jgi:hypothetical protein
MGQTNIKPQAVIKSAAAARGDDDTTVVGVYDILPPSSCVRKAYYRRKAHAVERQKSWSSCSRPANVLFKLKCAPVPIRQVKHALSDIDENSGEKQWLLKRHCKLNA